MTPTLPFPPEEGMLRFEVPADRVNELFLLDMGTGETFCLIEDSTTPGEAMLLHGGMFESIKDLKQLELLIRCRSVAISTWVDAKARQQEIDFILRLLAKLVVQRP